jgi:hypothetical protein
LIEDGAERFNGFGCLINASNGNWTLEPDSMHQGIDVYLGDTFVGVFCMPGFQALFQTPNVLLSPSQPALRAIKRVAARGCRGREIRSDKRARV